MSVMAVVGAQWGDEGKGKITDALAGTADVVARFQGGNNAGHAVFNGYGSFVLRMLPAGVFRSHVLNVLGPGVAVNVDALLNELAMLQAADVPEPKLLISDRAQVVLPYHIAFDELEEKRLAERSFGSTKNGIAPHYADKYLKVGIQVGDLFHRTRLVELLDIALVQKNVLLKYLYGKHPINAAVLADDIYEKAKCIERYVGNTHHVLQNALAGGQTIFLEGQLGALRDPDHGIYPFTTSSSTLAGFATTGAGIPPHEITKVVSVVKAYSSCVGSGPFVGELAAGNENTLRLQGAGQEEQSKVNGPLWRVGWFDVVATRYGCELQGTTVVALTLLDVLSYLDEIPVCVRYEIDGKETDQFPQTDLLDRAQPVYHYVPGWNCDISTVRQYVDLPDAAKNYVAYIENLVGYPVRWISVGPKRDQLIAR